MRFPQGSLQVDIDLLLYIAYRVFTRGEGGDGVRSWVQGLHVGMGVGGVRGGVPLRFIFDSIPKFSHDNINFRGVSVYSKSLPMETVL